MTRFIRNPSDELALAAGCRFDEAAGERPIIFIEKWCRQSMGRWADQPLILLDWQRDFLRRLFGWRRPDGFRRFRRAYLEVGKKNGKSTLLSALALYLLLADDAGPKLFINATDREQASIIFDEARNMVRASPELERRLTVVDSRKRIVYPKGRGYLQANSSEAPSKDGANASAVIFDELHRQPDRALWDMFEYAGISREQPLTLSITTAGEDETGIWFEQRDYSEKVNAGTIPDYTHLGVIYRAEADDDIDDPRTWQKANPSLGHILRVEDFHRDLIEAKEVSTKLALFKRLRLNIVGRVEARFLTEAEWKECDSPPFELERFLGRECWLGYDGAENSDITALVTLFGDEDEGLDILARFFMAEEMVADLEKRDKVPYRHWIEQGWITAVPGNFIGTRAPRAEVIKQATEFEIKSLFIDPWKAREFGAYLSEEEGVACKELPQTIGNLAAATGKLQAWARAGLFRHGGNPVLAWMAGNAIAWGDSNGNIRLHKAKSKHRIDGMAALVNAIAAMTADDDGGASVYESRGILTL